MATQAAQPGVRYLSSIEIEAKAREARETHQLDTIPVDPFALAQALGIEVWTATFGKPTTVGWIEKEGETVKIWVKKTDPPLRKRFTLAHELGHFFLHFGTGSKYIDTDLNLYRRPRSEEDPGSDAARREIQANLFAASLLMPERQVRQFWTETRSVKEMARIFIVSNEAMGYRIAELGLE